MRIVVAIPYAPWPVTLGTDRLILNLLEGLAARHEVLLVTMALDAGQLAGLSALEREHVSVRAILAPNKASAAHRAYYKMRNAAAALAGVPMQVSYAAPRPYLDLIAGASREWKADLVLASYWHLYRLPDVLREATLALITHDLDFLVNEGRRRAASGAVRLLTALRTRANERIERLAYRRYDTILTVTAADAEVLGSSPVARGKRVLPLPLAIDLSVFKPDSFVRERDTILFPGMFRSDFNRDALRFLLTDVFPLVRAEAPRARLAIVGHGVTDDLRRLGGGGVDFVGGVEDILPWIGRCSLMVLPLRFCGGVRIRMMEAAAMGTPVVSTRVGVGGLGLAAGSEYLEAETAPELAHAIARLLRDAEEARRIGRNARSWAERNISLETYPARLERLLETIAGPG